VTGRQLQPAADVCDQSGGTTEPPRLMARERVPRHRRTGCFCLRAVFCFLQTENRGAGG